jgi:hypothetical protein
MTRLCPHVSEYTVLMEKDRVVDGTKRLNRKHAIRMHGYGDINSATLRSGHIDGFLSEDNSFCVANNELIQGHRKGRAQATVVDHHKTRSTRSCRAALLLI